MAAGDAEKRIGVLTAGGDCPGLKLVGHQKLVPPDGDILATAVGLDVSLGVSPEELAEILPASDLDVAGA